YAAVACRARLRHTRFAGRTAFRRERLCKTCAGPSKPPLHGGIARITAQNGLIPSVRHDVPIADCSRLGRPKVAVMNDPPARPSSSSSPVEVMLQFGCAKT